MSLLSGIAHFFVNLWNGLTGAAKKLLPVVEAVVNELKTVNASGVPSEILNAILGPVKGTAVEGVITSTLAAIGAGLAKIEGVVTETPEDAVNHLVNAIPSDGPLRTVLLQGIATQLYSAAADVPHDQAAGLTAMHYAGAIGEHLDTAPAAPVEDASADESGFPDQAI